MNLTQQLSHPYQTSQDTASTRGAKGERTA
jgi:hypothetical protein